MKSSVYLPFVLLIAFSQSAFADMFVGAGGGKTKFSIDYETTPSIFFDDNVNNGRILFGYAFKKNENLVRFETAYNYYGEWNPNNTKDKLTSFSLSWTPYIELSSGTYLVGKVGAFWWNSDFSGDEKIIESQGTDGVDYFYGVGIETQLVDKLSLRADFERHDIDYLQFDTMTIALIVKF